MRTWIILLLTATPFWMQAQTPEAWFERGNAAYAEQQFDAARVAYEAALSSGPHFESYFNLGNTFYRLKDYPRAILSYERAARLQPFNEDLAINLQQAQSRIQDQIEPLDKAGMGTLMQGLQSPSALGWYTWLALIFGIAVAACLFWRISKPTRKRAATGLAVLGGLGLVAVLLLGFWAKSAQSGRPEAILMDPKINVYTAPEGNDLAFVLHAGTHITILDEVDGWLKVEIVNGEIGWMPNSGYTKI